MWYLFFCYSFIEQTPSFVFVYYSSRNMALHTLLGANGTIATALFPILKAKNEHIRLVSRNPSAAAGAETFKADLLDADQVADAVRGSDIVYLLAGIQYDTQIWQRDWPIIMRNVIKACQATHAKLVFFDNAYMYGKVDGPITEETPYRPSSKKGVVRAEIALMLQKEMTAGTIEALIVRAADFYGPGVTDKSVAGTLVFTNMAKGGKARWFINADVPRSYNYVPDAAEAVYRLATHAEAYGQIWHLPCVQPALTGRQFVQLAAKYMNAPDQPTVFPKWLLKVAGWFVPFMKELYEMSYQDEAPYQFSSSKFEKAFGIVPTPYEEAIRTTAEWFLNNKKSKK